MTAEQLKKIACDAIDQNSEKIIALGEEIMSHPELGYKEFKTSQVVKRVLSELEIPYRDNLAVTGVKGMLKGKSEDVTVCVISELDAIVSSTHPFADKQTGASHACGHNVQLANMLGVAMALKGVAEHLCGNVCFFAVPAEEYIEYEYRQKLADEGKIKFFGGKQELMRIGEFSDIDMAIMTHAQGDMQNAAVLLEGGSLGFVAKSVEYYGKAAHAAGAPHKGINALNAANLTLSGIGALRETFRDDDKVRVHPIITNGGEIVNVVPAYAKMEMQVRSCNYKAMEDANKKVNRAVEGACHIIGADYKITDMKGYLPLVQNKQLSDIFKNNSKSFVDDSYIIYGVDTAGSTDIGDLSGLIPCIQPTVGGYCGSLHSADFSVCDKNAAYIVPAKIIAMTVIDLLCNNAALAKKVKEGFTPLYTLEEYVEL